MKSVTGLDPNFRRHPFLEFLAPPCVTIAAYYPALFHVARADQLAYLADMAGIDDWFTLAVKSFSFARERLFVGGDHLLFRPLLYFLLGTEKWLFGYNFLLWQAVGILLHICVLWALLILLRQLGFGSGAVALTCFTAVLLPSIELVIWHHLHAYLLFALLILLALAQAHLHVLEGHVRWHRLLTIALLLLMASFLYEVGSVYCALFTGYLWATSPNKPIPSARASPHDAALGHGVRPRPSLSRVTTLVPLVPAFLYAFASVVDFWWRGVVATELRPISAALLTINTISHTLNAAIWWIYLVVFLTPEHLSLDPVGRTVVRAGTMLSAPSAPLLGATAGTFLLVLMLILMTARRQPPSRRAGLAFAWLLFGLLATYTLIVVAGRANSRGLVPTLTINLYYTYLFSTLLVPLTALILRLCGVLTPSRRRAARALALAFALLIVYNAQRLYLVNRTLAGLSEPVRTSVATVEQIRATHRNDPDFSFSVPPGSEGNPLLPWLHRTGDPLGRRYHLLEALYPRHYRPTGAQYQLAKQAESPRTTLSPVSP